MKSALAAILACLCLASCAGKIPRAIIAPPSVVAEISTTAAERATGATRTSVRDIAAAGEETRRATAKLRTTSERLRDEINRAELLASANVELQSAFVEIQKFAKQLSDDLSTLSASLAFAEEKERIALTTVDSLTDEMSALKANAKAQAVQIANAKTQEATLRTQVETLSSASNDLAIAKDKAASRLRTVWKLTALSAFLAVLLFRKPIGILFGVPIP